MSSFWEAVRNRLREAEPVYVILVVDHSVHSPGTTGARLAVFADGSTAGTIGGGIMERNAVRSAQEVLAGGGAATPMVRKLYHRKEGDGEKSGLICAGFQTNLYMLLQPEEHLAVLDAIVGAEERDEPDVFEISPEGFRLVGRDGGTSVQSMLTGAGDSWVYRETARNLSRVAIMGGGHCGLALSRLMHRLGFHVSIFDTRPRVPTMLENDFSDEKHIVDDFAEAGSMVGIPAHTSVVVMTTALPSDVRALVGVSGISFPFVGVMGSRAKIVAIRKALLEEGVSQSWLDRLVAPVGMPIGSNTPDEIAVSVAAQLLQKRANRQKSSQI